MFLNVEEIVQLTGWKRRDKQIGWLRDHGYKFDVDGLNRPVVTVAEVNRKLLGGVAARKQEPNWDAMFNG